MKTIEASVVLAEGPINIYRSKNGSIVMIHVGTYMLEMDYKEFQEFAELVCLAADAMEE